MLFCAEYCFYFQTHSTNSVFFLLSWWNTEQLLSREVENNAQAVRKNHVASVSILPTVLLAPRLGPPVCMCILYPSASLALPAFLHISTSSFCPSSAWCEFWHATPALPRSTLFHFLPPGSLASSPGGDNLLTSGAAARPDGPIYQT